MVRWVAAITISFIVNGAHAQQLNPVQQQGLLAAKKILIESIQKQHANCEQTNRDVCTSTRVDVLEEVLEKWENTPLYGKYALDVLEWQTDLATAIADMADDYVLKHGALDAGFMKELSHRTASDPAFQPPKEYVYRHLGLAK